MTVHEAHRSSLPTRDGHEANCPVEPSGRGWDEVRSAWLATAKVRDREVDLWLGLGSDVQRSGEAREVFFGKRPIKEALRASKRSFSSFLKFSPFFLARRVYKGR